MVEAWRQWVLEVLRVPPEPRPPAGDPAALQVFRAAPQYFRYRLVLWGLRQLGVIAALFASLVALASADALLRQADPGVAETLPRVLLVVEGLAWVVFLVQLPFSYAVLRLDYELRWYMVTDRSLRVREGILRLREKTMTFANVQQLSVEQGPLQRLLGIADVKVESAGGGARRPSPKQQPGQEEGTHEVRFRGVANASELRDLVRNRVRRYRDAGLGDHGDVATPAPAPAGDPALAAARELLGEVRGLRSVLQRR